MGGIIILLLSLSNASTLMELVTTAESFVSVLNPLYTIVFVKAYRRSLINCFFRRNIEVASSNPYPIET